MAAAAAAATAAASVLDDAATNGYHQQAPGRPAASAVTPSPRADANGCAKAASLAPPPVCQTTQPPGLDTDFATLDQLCADKFVHPSRLVPVKTLGHGAFSIVELCHLKDASGEDTGQLVAVKRLRPEILSSQEDLHAFVRESGLLHQMHNPHIVQFVGCGHADASGPASALASAFLVQEYMNGGTLKALVLRQMAKPYKAVYSHADALRWCRQVAEGVAYLHACKPMIIHRDLKLSNILLSGPGHNASKMDAKIADFGLHAVVDVRSMRSAGQEQLCAQLRQYASGEVSCGELPDPARAAVAAVDSACAAHSRAMERYASGGHGEHLEIARSNGAALTDDDVGNANGSAYYDLTAETGTYVYMAPEVTHGERYNEKVDVFSFAVVVYELFTQTYTLSLLPPSWGAIEAETYAHKVAAGYRPSLPHDWPHGLRELVAACWSQSPEDRPAMAAVAARLARMEATGELRGMDAELGHRRHAHRSTKRRCCMM